MSIDSLAAWSSSSWSADPPWAAAAQREALTAAGASWWRTRREFLDPELLSRPMFQMTALAGAGMTWGLRAATRGTREVRGGWAARHNVATPRPWLNVNGNVLTISVRQNWVDRMLRSLAATPAALGLVSVDIDDHGAGRHHPDGILIIDNGRAPTMDQGRLRIDYLEFAPAVLEFFGVPRPRYMIEPRFEI